MPNDMVEVVENSKRSDLYWLVFVARHELAHKLGKGKEIQLIGCPLHLM